MNAINTWDLGIADLPTVREDTCLSEVAERLATSGHDWAAVEDAEGRLIGVVSVADVTATRPAGGTTKPSDGPTTPRSAGHRDHWLRAGDVMRQAMFAARAGQKT
jgi:hypothetical protein